MQGFYGVQFVGSWQERCKTEFFRSVIEKCEVPERGYKQIKTREGTCENSQNNSSNDTKQEGVLRNACNILKYSAQDLDADCRIKLDTNFKEV